MKTKRTKLTITALATLLFCGMAQSASAQNVDVRVSASEAYVGMPIVLQVAIENASEYEAPSIPTIDGCDVRSAGAPSQSSQIMIINGRRSESRSVTMQYLITPRREGTFEIPPLTVKVNGRDQKTQTVRFVATRSETGDLLFVEIEGGKDKVFVGQPLDLTLKIWVKPFVDRGNNIKLSEANMWQTISEQTSWGSFASRLQELAENNQRPGGQVVLRDDGSGNEREYYLYEIEATVYPKRPGQIDADDVQVVVKYPTGLGKSHDPFENMFSDSPFGGSGSSSRISSRMQQMMSDDFFGGSPFGNRLSVTSSRPIVGQATVDSTQVVPVPTAGRPADYRGAVGRYQIVTQATSTAVSAGDPITLNIGILGTGPMELVQAPPLTELSSLTTDFKVEDQALAGFVKDETKVFPTTIRPRRVGITQIPAIPFSFFDPDTETFQTAMSEPISITVDKSESLALDAIVGNARRSDIGNDEAGFATKTLEPNFTNNNSASVLVSQSPISAGNWWWAFVVVPPFVWLGTLLVRNRDRIVAWLPNFKSAKTKCVSAIDRAKDRTAIENALVRFVSRRLGSRIPTRSVHEGMLGRGEDPSFTRRVMNDSTAVGALRSNGLYQLASQVESFFQRNQHSAFSSGGEQSLDETKQQARKLTEKINAALGSLSQSQVRRSKKRRSDSNRKATVLRTARTAQKASMLLIAALLALSSNVAFADDTLASTEIQNRVEQSVQLSESQQQTILTEAGEIYSRTTEFAKTDRAESNDLFTSSAAKYQLLVDSGIHNADLYMNLGNACLQSNQLGHAIANYERAQTLDPANRQLQVNLEFANSLVKNPAVDSTNKVAMGSASLATIFQWFRSANGFIVSSVGMQSMVWLLVISSLVFWAVFIARAAGFVKVARRWAIVPLILLLVAAASVALSNTSTNDGANGVIVANNVTLHSGDGKQFGEVASLGEAQGHRVTVLAKRGNWAQVRTADGHVGWIEDSNVEM